MSRHADPLVALWRQPGRPLNWRPWTHLTEAKLARMRFLLIEEMRDLDHIPGGALWPWDHTHRQLLEIKMATGRQSL